MIHTRGKKDKLDLIKIENFCSSKVTVKRMKTSYRLGEICKSHP